MTTFAAAGQGFGYLGTRNADGTRPDVTPNNQNAFGADQMGAIYHLATQ